MIKTILIAVIVGGIAATIVMVVAEMMTDRANKKAAEKEIRQHDMVARAERLKRELIAHNREQLALDYLNDKK